MRLHRLKLVNFRQHAETEVVLGPGLTAIVGPNGSGKTTLLEAIAWALYGNVAARGSRDSLRRNGAPARAPVRVEVAFSLGPHDYRIARSLYGAELYQDGSEEPVANSHQAVTSKMGRLLGMSHEEFFSTYFTGQKELTVMANMGPTERGKFLSRLLGYEKLRQAQDHLRQHRSILRAEIAGLEQGLEDLERLKRERHGARKLAKETEKRAARVADERAAAEQALEEAGPAWTKMSELREVNLATDGDRRIAEQMAQEARREFERLDRELAEAINARHRFEAIRNDVDRAQAVRTELEHLDREAQAAGRRRSLSGQLSEVGEQVERLEQRLRASERVEEAHHKATEALAGARRALDDLRAKEENARTSWVRDRQDAETKRLALLDQYGDLKNHRERIVDAGPDGQCPTCARPLGTEYESVLESLSTQLEEIKSNGRYYKARGEQLGKEPDELRSAQRERKGGAKDLEAALQRVAESEASVQQRHETEREFSRSGERVRALKEDLASLSDQYEVERHDAVRKEMQRLEPIMEQATQFRVKAEHAERLVHDAEKAERTLSEREERVRQLTDAIAASGFSEEAYHQAQHAYETAEARLRELELRAMSLRGDEKAAQTTLENIERRMRERSERAAMSAAVRKRLTVHDELDAALEDLRGELNAKLRPDLSDLGSSFLSDLTDGRYQEFELDEQYRISVLEDGLAKPVISGGEEDLVNLALRLAISQMVAERAGQPLSLLVLDEIFGGLDDARRHGVVELLRRLGDRFPQVVLITHIESVKEGVDRVLRVSVDERARTAIVAEESGSEEYAHATA